MLRGARCTVRPRPKVLPRCTVHRAPCAAPLVRGAWHQARHLPQSMHGVLHPRPHLAPSVSPHPSHSSRIRCPAPELSPQFGCTVHGTPCAARRACDQHVMPGPCCATHSKTGGQFLAVDARYAGLSSPPRPLLLPLSLLFWPRVIFGRAQRTASTRPNGKMSCSHPDRAAWRMAPRAPPSPVYAR